MTQKEKKLTLAEYTDEWFKVAEKGQLMDLTELIGAHEKAHEKEAKKRGRK